MTIPSSIHRHRCLTRRPGFTLIELILYVAISAMIVVALLNVMVAILQTRGKATVGTEVQQNLRYAVDRVTLTSRGAVGINVGSSTFGSVSGVLSLALSGSTVNPTIFSLCGTRLCIKEGASSSAPLTDTGVVVDQFQLTNLSVPSLPGTVKVVMHARQAASAATAPQSSDLTVGTSITLRQ